MSELNNQRVAVLRSNPVAPDPRVEKLAQSLVDSGRLVFVVAWDRSGQQPTREKETPIGNIFRMRLKARYGSGIKNVPFLLIWQVYLVVWLCAHRWAYDVIHACDFDTVLPALFMRRAFRKKVVFDIFDFYSDSVRNTPGVILKAISRAERRAINSADVVILADESRKQQISESTPNKLVVVYNSPVDAAVIPSRSLRAGFRLAYVGLLVEERSLLEVIEIVGRHPEWGFDLAGFGGDETKIVRQASKYPNITWHGRVDYSTALSLMADADLLFAIYDPSVANHRYSSPNKVFEAMLLAKPLLVARDTNMDRIIEENHCGVVVEYGQQGQIERAMEDFASDPNTARQLGANGRLAYEKHFSWEIMKKRILELYSEL